MGQRPFKIMEAFCFFSHPWGWSQLINVSTTHIYTYMYVCIHIHMYLYIHVYLYSHMCVLLGGDAECHEELQAMSEKMATMNVTCLKDRL